MNAPERLRVLEDLVLLSTSVRVYADDATGSSAWLLDLGHQRFTFVISPDRWRGFSGEGQLLDRLAKEDADALLASVQGALSWQDGLDTSAMAEEVGVEVTEIESALALLAARGLVGFDLATGSYFHRVLPFDLSLVESLHPRLEEARRLVRAGAVEVHGDPDSPVATVSSEGVEHRVRLTHEDATCTCPWYAKHQGDRGPCKHVLATQMILEESER